MIPRPPRVDVAPGVAFGGGAPLAFIAGPCSLESADLALATARALGRIAGDLGVPLVFKGSFDKANRASPGAPRGLGLRAGLDVLRAVKEETGLPVLTDVHEPAQADAAAEVCDVLQVPAFLCRQTDLLTACGATGRVVNVKKGQFVAPEDMIGAVEKVRAAGGERVLLTERGTCFGYRDLVVDFRALDVLAALGCPVLFDATHSVQRPGTAGGASGGDRRFVPLLLRAAVAAGIDGVFMEVHPDPSRAHSDAATQVPLDRAAELISLASALDVRTRDLPVLAPLA
ncbi:3-deoxy-8-phosphooctulonate synthase [Myxococcota bacterium]|nr:3-deoxy-8-phosphooctulonate synthase [Myxococcota bacterium]